MSVARLFLLALLVGVSLWSCRDQSARLLPSEYSAWLPDIQTSFADYVGESRRQLSQLLQDVYFSDDTEPFGQGYTLEQVVNMRAPYQIGPDADRCQSTQTGAGTGFLLVHGLSDSPYLLSSIAGSVADALPCALVRGLLKPGHGTVPGDTLTTSRHDWARLLEYGVESFRGEVDRLYLIGYSAGATLAVQYADRNRDDELLAGLVMLSPALGLPRGAVWLSPFLRYVRQWLGIEQETDAAKYESFSINAGAEFYLLIRELRLQLMEPLDVPVFMVSSSDDTTVDVHPARDFFCTAVVAEPRHYIWYQSRFSDELDTCAGMEVITAAYPDKRLINYSHVGITIPPDDPHYGFDAAYSHCLYYGAGTRERQLCLESNTATVYGERNLLQSDGRHEGYLVRRATFNPRYQQMIDQMLCFVDDAC